MCSSEAIESGELDIERWESYTKLIKEEGFYQGKQITLRRKMSKARIKRKKVHYKDYKRNGFKIVPDRY